MSKQRKDEIIVKSIDETKQEIISLGISMRDKLILEYLIKCSKNGTHVQFTGIVEFVKGKLTEDQVTKSRLHLIRWGLVTKDNLNLNKERYRKLKKLIKEKLEGEVITITSLIEIMKLPVLILLFIAVGYLLISGGFQGIIAVILGKELNTNMDIISPEETNGNLDRIIEMHSPDPPKVIRLHLNETFSCQDVEYDRFIIETLDDLGNVVRKTVVCSRSIHYKE